MSNNYDADHAQDLDDRQQQYATPMRNLDDIGSVRSRLIGNLRESQAEAQNLANIYGNLARQLELQIVLVETKR